MALFPLLLGDMTDTEEPPGMKTQYSSILTHIIQKQ